MQIFNIKIMNLQNIPLEVLLIIFIVILIAIIFYLFSKISNKSGWNNESLKLLQEQIIALNRNIDFKLSQSNKNVVKQWEINSNISKNASEKIEEITKKLASLEETNKQIKDIWGQLEWLESILKNPKQKWNLWEYFLKELLDNVFWDYQYKMQYKIWDIGIVDAALFIWDKIIPIDSKFPYDNYERLINSDDEASIKIFSKNLKRDIINKIDETSKYIDTSLWTTDFAFMLIPAEWLYYDLFISKIWNINSKEIIEYWFSKKVIICSPSWFYAYLQTVIQWLRALKVEEETKEIIKQVEKLWKHLKDYEKWFTKLWNSLRISLNHYEDSEKRFWYIEKDIVKITGESSNIEQKTISLDKPDI